MTLTVTELTEQMRLELAAGKHTPSKGMMSMAKRGLAQAKGQQVSEDDIAVGRKIAAGAKLSDDHVKAMAAFHADHEYDCAVDSSVQGTTDMLWGGAPAAAWSAARSAAIDVSTMSEDPLELAADDDITTEIFVRDGFGEPTELSTEDGELIWAPILRSGTLATRPGPYGAKLREPLVIVPGRTADPAREIGLENLLENFHAGAIQHVTIPTSHENGVLENNGYIVDMKIVDSVKRPNERVLMGAHKVTEPDTLGRLERGSIANRSCGILHDYVDTESGRQFDQVVEHVALTNKPWVRGMAAYGELADVDLSQRRVVPMTLSEGPGAQTSTSTISEIDWVADSHRFSDEEYQRSCVIDCKTEDAADRYRLPVREPDGTVNRAAVHFAADRLASLGDVPSAIKREAAKTLCALYRGPLQEEPPVKLLKLAAVSTRMTAEEAKTELADVMWGDAPSLNTIRDQVRAQLSEFRNMGEPGGFPYYYVMDVTAEKALVQIEYGDPDGVDDAWVVPFTVGPDGDVKLSDYSQWTPVTKEWVVDEDAAQDKQELGAILGAGGMPTPDADGLSETTASERSTRLQLSQERRNNQQGGAKMPTTDETLDRLELSDEAKAVFQKLSEDNRRLAAQQLEAQSEARKVTVKARIVELQDKGFSPGFLAEYERIALADDGHVAAMLNLSEGGVARDVEQTATQLAERLIGAMAFDDTGKLALAGQGNVVGSPISGRPAIDNDDAAAAGGDKEPGTKTGDDLLAEWGKADPRLIEEFKTKLAPSPNGSAQ